jgi:hypothetical protein
VGVRGWGLAVDWLAVWLADSLLSPARFLIIFYTSPRLTDLPNSNHQQTPTLCMGSDEGKVPPPPTPRDWPLKCKRPGVAMNLSLIVEAVEIGPSGVPKWRTWFCLWWSFL